MPAGAGRVLRQCRGACGPGTRGGLRRSPDRCGDVPGDAAAAALGHGVRGPAYRRSEEHTSELQSLMRISYTVFCLKKKQQRHTRTTTQINNLTTNQHNHYNLSMKHTAN